MRGEIGGRRQGEKRLCHFPYLVFPLLLGLGSPGLLGGSLPRLGLLILTTLGLEVSLRSLSLEFVSEDLYGVFWYLYLFRTECPCFLFAGGGFWVCNHPLSEVLKILFYVFGGF